MKPRLSVIDAEFEIVSGPRRIGDAHPTRRRWVYAGLDGHGRALWYRPPRLNRWQFFLVLAGGLVGFWLLVILLVWLEQLTHHHWRG